MNDISELDYQQKMNLLNRLIDKRGKLSSNLTFKESQYYDLLTQWYNDNHRGA